MTYIQLKEHISMLETTIEAQTSKLSASERRLEAEVAAVQQVRSNLSNT